MAGKKSARSHEHDGFAQYLSRCGYTARTVETYLEVLAYLWRWRPETPPVCLSEADVQEFGLWLGTQYRSARGERLAASSRIRILSALNHFGRWLVEAGFADMNPCSSIIFPKESPRRQPEVPPLGTIRRLLHAPCLDSHAVRDAAVVWTLAVTGVRASELAGANMDDVDLDRREFTVRSGKGGTGRITFLTTEAARVLRRYQEEGRPVLLEKERDALFLTDRGLRMCRKQVGLALKRICQRAGLAPHRPHQLRHFFCSILLERGADLRTIGELAGHRRLSTTTRYAQVDLALLHRIYSQAHPRR